ncbi:MAG: DUF2059 domain-containing protein [Treponema sp.]|jgi:hypothetical protein|nr:DUF2059 domain-containing protein [Treponema sp.]
MKRSLFVFLFIAGMAVAGHGQTKRADIVKLLDISNTKMQAAQLFDLMMPSLKTIAPDAPVTFWTMFQSKLDMDSFVDLFIPVYDKYFTHDEIKGLIQFYESPIGKKLLAVTPLITQDSYGIGQAWGEKLARDIIEELIEQGYQ